MSRDTEANMTDPGQVRVLVVNGEPFSDATATGITLCNLFTGISKDDIAQIYTANFPIRTDVCGRYFKLAASNLFRSGATTVPNENVGVSSPIASVDRNSPKAKLRRLLAPFLECLSYRLSPELIRELQAFQPSIIYTLGGSVRQMQLALSLADQLELPLVIHFMDDWPSTMYRVPHLFFVRKRLKRLTKEAVRRSKARLVISEAMAEEYRSRYDAEFLPFMNCVGRDKVAPVDRENGGKIEKICFFGGLHLGRGEVVEKLADAIRALGLTDRLEIELYCRPADVSTYSAKFSRYKHVHFRDAVSPSRVGEVMRQAGALLHVESFDSDHRAYTRLSISTKIPEYLAAGRPIIAIGPPEVASMKYLAENGAAIVVKSFEASELEAGITALLNPSIAGSIVTNARNVVLTRHLSENERQRFKNVLAAAAAMQ